MVDQPVYSQRFVAFLDIMGFRNHVQESSGTAGKADEILSVLETIQTFVQEVDSINTTPISDGEQVTAFSDSIVISRPVDNTGVLFTFLLNIASIQLELLIHGYVIRGGLCMGQMYHNRSIAFGPAFVEAYDLESQFAHMPRVVLHTNTIDYALGLPSVNGLEDDRQEIFDLLIQDEVNPDIYYVDFLRQHQELDHYSTYVDCVISIREIIVKNLADEQLKCKDKIKYEWLRDYFNRVHSDYEPLFESNEIYPI